MPIYNRRLVWDLQWVETEQIRVAVKGESGAVRGIHRLYSQLLLEKEKLNTYLLLLRNNVWSYYLALCLLFYFHRERTGSIWCTSTWILRWTDWYFYWFFFEHSHYTLSVSFRQCSVLFFISVLLVWGGQAGEDWGLSKESNALGSIVRSFHGKVLATLSFFWGLTVFKLVCRLACQLAFIMDGHCVLCESWSELQCT